MKAAAIAAVCLGLAGCAGMGRTVSYGTERADAVTTIEGRRYNLYVHPTDDTILMQRPIATGAGQAFVSGATMGIANPGFDERQWKAAAEHFVAPLKCEIGDVYLLGKNSGTWEARFECPAGVDLRDMVIRQRGMLRQGWPLKP